jgi:putative FmdB family regulatory protein
LEQVRFLQRRARYKRNGELVPIYQFKCECGIEFEREFKMNDKHLALCECGKLVKKSFTAVPAHFKGTGWGSK